MAHFRQKWTNLITRFGHTEQQQDTEDFALGRRPSHASSSCCSTSPSINDDMTFWSDSMSTISEQTISKRQREASCKRCCRRRQFLPLPAAAKLFRRRESNSSICSSCSSIAGHLEEETFEKQTQRLQSLYELALDEIKYAEDSRGSPYYSGDRVTAREAIDGCANAFIQLQQQILDPSLQSLLQSTMAPRILELQSKFDALPPEIDPSS